MKVHCCDEQRLEVIKLAGSANGIEYLEVRDHLEPTPALRQRTLLVRLLRPGFALTPDNVRIDGGERIPTIGIEWVAAANNLPAGTDPALVDGIDDLPRTLVIRTDSSGDFSRYALRLVANSGTDQPPGGFDPVLSSIAFSFKAECPSDFDCAVDVPCPPMPPLPLERPDIDYLAKDYSGFRRLMLDRLNLLVPGWTERSAADVGVTLVELLAYAADNLSYRQDAIANEAFLGTARRRVSVRRHARLVDYRLHDGCNARAFVHFRVTRNNVALPRGTALLTRSDHTPVVVEPASRIFSEALAAGASVFETTHAVSLHKALNQLDFYTWGQRGCALPRGAIAATLLGAQPLLKVGDVLVFQEVCSPTTFKPEDADRAKRWAVRLTRVAIGVDPSGKLFAAPPVNAPQDITEIEWDSADALPFPLCLSILERSELVMSVALGNIVLADHGRPIAGESLGVVPAPKLKRAAVTAASHDCKRIENEPVPVRFRPHFATGPVTQGFDIAALLAVPLTQREDWSPASALVARDPHQALPLIKALTGTLNSVVTGWTVRRDLLASAAAATDFIVESAEGGRAFLRFGDDAHGRRPDSGTNFTASYRVGNGVAGNVGADSITRIVANTAGDFESLTNPLAAAGGVDPEPIEAVRRDAPEAFRTQERAVTATDYAAAAERRSEVQRAAATFRWTGSWHTVFVTADRQNGA